MAKKAPRRTAERILEVTLDLFNRFGEPNVSTTLISSELNISPGNLYYHYPAKEELVTALFNRYETALDELLDAAPGVHDVEDAWFFMHTLFELVWQYRFLYRDLNDLLSKSFKSRYKKRYCHTSSNNVCMKNQASSTSRTPGAASSNSCKAVSYRVNSAFTNSSLAG